jgi:Fe-S cluster assembly ATP-binding protein
MGVLELREVSLSLGGKQILDRVTVDFWEGHIHALCGPNGAGKSTLASVIMGLSGYRDIQGEVLLDGQVINGVSVDERARRGITLAWQEPARFEGLRVDAFIRAGARDKSPQRVSEVLQTVGLAPAKYRSRAVDKTLSGGERKRIELASILAMEPRIVLMDEPDSGIDVEALEQIFSSLQTFKERGATVIMITHSAVVLRHAEHAFLMCDGKVIEKGAIDKVDRYFEEKCLACTHVNEPLEEELT